MAGHVAPLTASTPPYAAGRSRDALLQGSALGIRCRVFNGGQRRLSVPQNVPADIAFDVGKRCKCLIYQRLTNSILGNPLYQRFAFGTRIFSGGRGYARAKQSPVRPTGFVVEARAAAVLELSETADALSSGRLIVRIRRQSPRRDGPGGHSHPGISVPVTRRSDATATAKA